MNLVIFNNNLSSSEVIDLLTWCENYFGPRTEIHNSVVADRHRWGYRFDLGGMKIFFIRDDDDYMFFRLRWSNLTSKTRY
jgi:hypothetical protein